MHKSKTITIYCRFCLGFCGLKIEKKDETIKVFGDKSNLHSKGYICRKGANIFNYYGRKKESFIKV
tara:strand:- start:353 stop:550 length:198 start_codon:yes stop_codon:yes gene_type:complete